MPNRECSPFSASVLHQHTPLDLPTEIHKQTSNTAQEPGINTPVTALHRSNNNLAVLHYEMRYVSWRYRKQKSTKVTLGRIETTLHSLPPPAHSTCRAEQHPYFFHSRVEIPRRHTDQPDQTETGHPTSDWSRRQLSEDSRQSLQAGDHHFSTEVAHSMSCINQK